MGGFVPDANSHPDGASDSAKSNHKLVKRMPNVVPDASLESLEDFTRRAS